MNNLQDIMYVNCHYPRKPMDGIVFVLVWALGYICAVGALCVYMWVNR